jgi:hypothetical protein
MVAPISKFWLPIKYETITKGIIYSMGLNYFPTPNPCIGAN